VYRDVFGGDIIMGETKAILCGRCHVAVEERANPDGQMMAVCASCGESDTVENAVGEAGDYLAEKVARDALAGFENMPSSPYMKVTVAHSPERTYRFILAD
jgi:hypothetical protein